MSTPSTSNLVRFQHAETGSVGMIFALISIVLMMFGGLAIDFSRIVDLRSRLSDAVDSATLAAGKALLDGQMSEAEIVTMAKTYVVQNSGPLGKLARLGEPDVKINRETGAVAIAVDARLGLTLARIGGFDDVNVPIYSEAVFRQKDIEVGMALDITGSMSARVDGQTKMDALKGAFSNFAGRLLSDERPSSQRVRIALAPYSSGINLGPRAATVSGNASLDGCVTEARGGTYSDAMTTYLVATRATRDTDSTEGLQGYTCPTNEVMPLTDDREALIREVNSYVPRGATAGHLGAQWAWNLISDEWASVFTGSSQPDGYNRVDDEKLLKAVILMSDGIFNTAYNGPRSSVQAIRLCEAMKEKGIAVFTIGFDLASGSTAEQTLKSCATPGDDYFAAAATPAELDAAFSKFADKLSRLRIAK